ncbi:phage tail spike protein [Bacillus andreraoultii]|uniref:phage tail spike protein n=1 Tax=Bacillus andreraoultii TaxID=1499685 RepID=UPI00053AB47B|nr:phage tail spike protein [Bacillus andreraoultii]
MANLKAFFTDKHDFNVEKFDFPIVPYMYFDGENLPNDVSIGGGSYANSIVWGDGNPTIVDGVIGKASKFNSNYLIWRNWEFPAMNKFSISFWVKFDPTDFNSWTILATTRYDGYNTSNRGFHVAAYSSRSFNIRLYGTNGQSINVYSNDSGQSGKLFEADKWYHVAVIFDGTNLKGIVNGEEWISVYAGNITFTSTFERSLTLGDMLDGNSYPFNGIIDEFTLCLNDNAWTKDQAIQYYNAIAKGEYLDDETDTGALQLGKSFEGNYPTSLMTWESQVIDLGGIGQFVDYGRIETVSTTSQVATLTLYTRSSSDGVTWEEWRTLGENGLIQSTNQRYLQVRVDFLTTDPTQTPILYEIAVWEEEKAPDYVPLPNLKIHHNDPIYLYRDLETGLDSLGVLRNAYDVFIEEEINGEDILSFKLPRRDLKRQEIGDEPVELIAVIAERYYVVKEVLDKRDSDGNLYTEFICEALWTELRDYFVDTIEVVEVTARDALETIFENVFREAGDPEIDWKVGNVEITKKRTLRSDWKDVLSLIHEVQNIWGGEILFDTKNKYVHLLNQIGGNSGVRFYYNKNLQNIERIIDTYDLITRIYPSGKGGLDIRTINNGVPYLENRTWVDKLKLRRKVIPYRWKDERYTIPENLKEDAQKLLDEMSKPKIAYKTSVHDLSSLSGHEHETFNLGDLVTVVDKELFDEEVINRIVRRKMDVRKPENTEIELSQPIKTLADIRSRALDDQIETMIGSDPLSTNDVQQMTVFNHLLNSRADEGINGDWVKEGTDFDIANVGFSGNWSFVVKPDYGRTNTLTQTVEGVSHRTTYTVSAAVATQGDITRGSAADAFVGIKVIVHYQDGGEPDTFYLAVPDVTNNEPPKDSNA